VSPDEAVEAVFALLDAAAIRWALAHGTAQLLAEIKGAVPAPR
jgi:hypothetical protein